MGVLRRKKQSWPILDPGQSIMGRVAILDNSRVTWPQKPGSIKPAVEWVRRPSRPREDLPSSRAAISAGRLTFS